MSKLERTFSHQQHYYSLLPQKDPFWRVELRDVPPARNIFPFLQRQSTDAQDRVNVWKFFCISFKAAVLYKYRHLEVARCTFSSSSSFFFSPHAPHMRLSLGENISRAKLCGESRKEGSRTLMNAFKELVTPGNKLSSCVHARAPGCTTTPSASFHTFLPHRKNTTITIPS